MRILVECDECEKLRPWRENLNENQSRKAYRKAAEKFARAILDADDAIPITCGCQRILMAGPPPVGPM